MKSFFIESILEKTLAIGALIPRIGADTQQGDSCNPTRVRLSQSRTEVQSQRGGPKYNNPDLVFAIAEGGPSYRETFYRATLNPPSDVQGFHSQSGCTTYAILVQPHY
jgi:hypothetical protein